MKEAAGRAAVDALVHSGMKLGLGTGSTAIHAIRRVGELLAQGTLKDINAFVTSFQSEIECEKLGIPFYPLNSRKLAGSLFHPRCLLRRCLLRRCLLRRINLSLHSYPCLRA